MSTTRNFKRKAIFAALALGVYGTASAVEPILIDPDGPGADPAVIIGSADWAPGNALAIGGNAGPAGIQLSAHSNLSIFTNASGTAQGGLAPGLAAGTYEWTFNTTLPEQITLVAPGGDSDGDGIQDSLTSIFATGGAPINYFEVYFDDFTAGVASDPLTGAGFDDGRLILSGTIASLSGNFTSFQEVPNTSGTNTGLGVTLDANGLPLATASTNPNAETAAGANGYNLLDSFGPDDAGLGQQTVDGQGSTTLNIDVLFQDAAFFLEDISSLIIDVITNTFNNVPFTQTNPSAQFDIVAGTTGPAFNPALGTINGLNPVLSGVNFAANQLVPGLDVQFQTDATSSFNVTRVPEPGLLALMGLGLVGLGAMHRRRRRSA